MKGSVYVKDQRGHAVETPSETTNPGKIPATS
jgi:hypothetical protein